MWWMEDCGGNNKNCGDINNTLYVYIYLKKNSCTTVLLWFKILQSTNSSIPIHPFIPVNSSIIVRPSVCPSVSSRNLFLTQPGGGRKRCQITDDDDDDESTWELHTAMRTTVTTDRDSNNSNSRISTPRNRLASLPPSLPHSNLCHPSTSFRRRSKLRRRKFQLDALPPEFLQPPPLTQDRHSLYKSIVPFVSFSWQSLSLFSLQIVVSLPAQLFLCVATALLWSVSVDSLIESKERR